MDERMITSNLYPLVATANTTRVAGVDDIGTSVAVSRLIYIQGSNAVILAPEDRPAFGAAATTLIHFPIDAPVLLNPPRPGRGPLAHLGVRGPDHRERAC